MGSSNKINKNAVALAGEFAVLSQLALRGYDANLTLGHTKGVDILVSDSKRDRLYKLEVKTKYENAKESMIKNSKVHGRFLGDWMMNKNHETDVSENLFYCFVSVFKETNVFKFYIVPSKVVASYVRRQHKYWLKCKKNEKKKVKDTKMRIFRVTSKSESPPIAIPFVEDYENNWDFKG